MFERGALGQCSGGRLARTRAARWGSCRRSLVSPCETGGSCPCQEPFLLARASRSRSRSLPWPRPAAPANSFAVGSAKTDLGGLVGVEHASFSAHNVPGLPGSCDATGHIVYKSDAFEFTAKINELTIVGNAAYFGGPVTKAVTGPVEVGDEAFFNTSDSGMPGGTGDTFLFENTVAGGSPGTACFEPIPGHPITQGNIVLKAMQP